MALKSKEEPHVGAQPFRVLHKGYSFTQPLRQGLKTSREDLDNAIPMKRWKSPAMINHWLVSYFLSHCFSLKQLVIGSTTALCSKRGQLLPLAHSSSQKWPRPSPEVRVIHYFATSRLGCPDTFHIWKSVEFGQGHRLMCDYSRAGPSVMHRARSCYEQHWMAKLSSTLGRLQHGQENIHVLHIYTWTKEYIN